METMGLLKLIGALGGLSAFLYLLYRARKDGQIKQQRDNLIEDARRLGRAKDKLAKKLNAGDSGIDSHFIVRKPGDWPPDPPPKA